MDLPPAPTGPGRHGQQPRPDPLHPFGHGLSYTDFTWEDIKDGEETEIGTDDSYDISVTVRNTGPREGTEVVQLYLHDPVARVTRPDVRLIGYHRLTLPPGQARRITFTFHPDLSAFTDGKGQRVVEPGALELRLGSSSTNTHHTTHITLTGPERHLGPDRQLRCDSRETEAH